MGPESLKDEAAPARALTVPREVEALPNYGVDQVDVDYKLLLEKYRERSLFVDGIRKDALTKTKPHNWLARKDNKTGNVSLNLMGPGAERIKTNCPIGFLNRVQREEQWSNEAGAGYTVYFEAEVYLGEPRAGTLPVIGSCRSDDDFFSTEHAEMPYNPENPEHAAAIETGEGRLSYDKKTLYIRRRIPANEVHKDNIIKSALTNLVVNAVTRVLGIRQISPEELKEAGIDVDRIPSIEYGSNRAQSGRLTPAQEQQRANIWKWLLEMAGGDEASARAALKARSAFKDREGVEDVARLSEKQIAFHFDRVKKDHDEWQQAGQAQPKAAEAKPAPQRAAPTAQQKPAKGGPSAKEGDLI